MLLSNFLVPYFCVRVCECKRFSGRNPLKRNLNKFFEHCLIILDLVIKTNSSRVVLALNEGGCFFNKGLKWLLF